MNPTGLQATRAANADEVTRREEHNNERIQEEMDSLDKLRLMVEVALAGGAEDRANALRTLAEVEAKAEEALQVSRAEVLNASIRLMQEEQIRSMQEKEIKADQAKMIADSTRLMIEERIRRMMQ